MKLILRAFCEVMQMNVFDQQINIPSLFIKIVRTDQGPDFQKILGQT